MARPDSSEYFSYAIHQYPFQFFNSGLKLGIDINIKHKYLFQPYINYIHTQFPVFYEVDLGANTLGVKVYPEFVSERNIGAMIKHQLGGSADVFHGYYLMAFAETGIGREVYQVEFVPLLPTSLQINDFLFQRFGSGIGRHWRLFNAALLDINVGLGYYNVNKFNRVILPPFFSGRNSDQLYFLSSMSLGIGHESNHLRQRKPSTDVLHYGLSLDANAIFKNGIEGGIYTLNRGKHLWYFFGGFATRNINQINLSKARTFTSYRIGAQCRRYPYAGSRKEGLYYALSLASGHMRAEMVEVNDNQEDVIKVQKYDPQHLGFSMGFTHFYRELFMLDGYVRSTFTYSAGSYVRSYPFPDEATGIHTVVGLRLGLVNLKKYGTEG